MRRILLTCLAAAECASLGWKIHRDGSATDEPIDAARNALTGEQSLLAVDAGKGSPEMTGEQALQTVLNRKFPRAVVYQAKSSPAVPSPSPPKRTPIPRPKNKIKTLLALSPRPTPKPKPRKPRASPKPSPSPSPSPIAPAQEQQQIVQEVDDDEWDPEDDDYEDEADVEKDIPDGVEAGDSIVKMEDVDLQFEGKEGRELIFDEGGPNEETVTLKELKKETDSAVQGEGAGNPSPSPSPKPAKTVALETKLPLKQKHYAGETIRLVKKKKVVPTPYLLNGTLVVPPSPTPKKRPKKLVKKKIKKPKNDTKLPSPPPKPVQQEEPSAPPTPKEEEPWQFPAIGKGAAAAIIFVGAIVFAGLGAVVANLMAGKSGTAMLPGASA